MTEAFRSPPPPQYPGQAAARQDVAATVQRVMGDDIAPPHTHRPPPGTALRPVRLTRRRPTSRRTRPARSPTPRSRPGPRSPAR